MRFVFLLSSVLIFAALYQQSVNAELDPDSRPAIEYKVLTGSFVCNRYCDQAELEGHSNKVKELVNHINSKHGGYARIEKLNITPNINRAGEGSQTRDYIYTLIYSMPKN